MYFHLIKETAESDASYTDEIPCCL